MSATLSPDDFGEPALKLAGLRIWVHERRPDLPSGVLSVTAHCEAHGARVWVHGPILMAHDIERFAQQCEVLSRGECNTAALEPYDPELRVTIEKSDSLGHLRARIEITPDHLSQKHLMDFEIDRTYLRDISSACARLLAE